jgi:hypothetical protein
MAHIQKCVLECVNRPLPLTLLSRVVHAGRGAEADDQLRVAQVDERVVDGAQDDGQDHLQGSIL